MDIGKGLSLAGLITTLALASLPPAAAQGAAQASAANDVFGVRIGVSLDSQLRECPADAVLVAPGQAGCWRRDNYGSRTVLIAASLRTEIGAFINVRRVREVGKLVVEVEVDFRPEDVKRVERYLLRQKGKPTETERYERAGRLTGVRSYTSHVWQGDGVRVFFQENASSGNGAVRGYLESWARSAAAK